MTQKSIKAELVHRVRNLVTRIVDEKVYDSLLLQGRMASWHMRSQKSIGALQDAEFKVFSQCGQDGIIDWMIERAGIPPHLHTFIEFGVETYREANTRFLLENRGWRGLIMDGNPKLNEIVRRDHHFYRYDLGIQSSFITRENINRLILQSGFSGEIGLLSIDIDGNDYWVWEAINAVRPVICICEYNSAFGDLHAVSIPYNPEFQCGRTHTSRLYFGTSIAALKALASRKGYKFLGTTIAGNDAFFIRKDYASRFDGAINNIVAIPAHFCSPRDCSDQLTQVENSIKHRAIQNLPLIDTESGKAVTLAELQPIYSADWLQRISRGTGQIQISETSLTP